ncbi:conserved hypothetical protein [Desulfosarcina cetonica]|nr:conserved hypothetical protein [Desulfosarcina cetonica]
MNVHRGLADLFHHAGRQGDIAGLIGDLLAFVQTVADHFSQRLGFLGIVVFLVKDHPGVGGDGIGIFARGIRQPHDHVFRNFGMCQCRLSACQPGRDIFAVLVLQAGHGDVGHAGVAVFNVADGTGGLFDQRGNPIVFRTLDHFGGARPVDGFAEAGAILEFRGDRTKVLGKHKRGARAVGAAYHGDVRIGQAHAGIGGDDRRIVPLLDLTQKDGRIDVAGQFQRFDAFEVVGQDHFTGRHGQQLDAAGDGRHLLIGHGGIAGGEIDDAILKITDAGAGSLGLIVDLNILVGAAEGFEPGGINRGRKAGTRTDDVDFGHGGLDGDQGNGSKTDQAR